MFAHLSRDLVRSAFAIVALTGLCMSAEPPRSVQPGKDDSYPPGWTVAAPREEIRPEFSFDPKGGPNKRWQLGRHARPSRRTGRLVSEVVRGDRRRVLPLSRGAQDVRRRVCRDGALWYASSGRMRTGRWCSPTYRRVACRKPARRPVPNRNIPAMARPMRKAGPRSAASIASRPRPRAPSSNCTCNGRRTGAWSGARSSSRRPSRRRPARCGWPRFTTSRPASRREPTARSSRR